MNPAPPPPAPVATWQWTPIGAPLGDTEIQTIRVDPADVNTWYVGGGTGLFVTRDYGRSWTRSLTGSLGGTEVELAPADPCTVYAAENTFPSGPYRVRRSSDKGQTWTTLYEAPESIRSIHAGRRDRGVLIVGTQLDPRQSSLPDAFYRSLDGGATWTRHAYDGRSRGLIPWDIEEDVTGTIYAGTEIYDHPQPYRPPFFRSLDRGGTWQDVTGVLPWHVGALQAHPGQPIVLALTEGAGLFSTSDSGTTWRRIGSASFAATLLLDAMDPNRLYGGELVFGSRQGGAFVSTNGGAEFRPIGLSGLIVGSLALDGTSRTVFAACYRSGIWTATVPTQP